MVFIDELVQVGSDFRFIYGLGQIEVQSATPVLNAATGDLGRYNGTQHMQATMHSHDSMTSIPVKTKCHAIARLHCGGERRGVFNDMYVFCRLAIFKRISDDEFDTGRSHAGASVTGLSAASRVKDGLIHLNAAFINSSDCRRTIFQVAVLAKKFLGQFECSAAVWL